MRLVCLSDTHCRHARIPVPDGDLLLHAGDFTSRGRLEEIRSFCTWLETMPHRRKVLIAGNHEILHESSPEAARAATTGCVYLEDSGVEIEGLRIYGSPWQPEFLDWAFNLPRGEPLAKKWALIPAGVDILITHGPPRGICDRTVSGEAVGCEALLQAAAKAAPRLHLFGHIHEGYGHARLGPTLCVNASICDEAYRPVQAPVVIDMDPSTKDFTIVSP